MNFIRSLMSVFLLVLFCIAIAGCIYVGRFDPSKMLGARLVLGACMVAAVGSMVLLWTYKDTEQA